MKNPPRGRIRSRHTIHGYEETIYDLNESPVISLIQRNAVEWLTYCLWRGQLSDKLHELGFTFDLDITPYVDHFQIPDNQFIDTGMRVIPEIRTDTILHFHDEGDSIYFALLAKMCPEFNLLTENVIHTARDYNDVYHRRFDEYKWMNISVNHHYGVG